MVNFIFICIGNQIGSKKSSFQIDENFKSADTEPKRNTNKIKRKS